MRRAVCLLVVAAAVAGCGKPAGPGGAPAKLPDGPATPAPAVAVLEAYLDNPIAADAKYKGKKLKTAFSVSEIGRKDDQPYIGGTNTAGNPPACFVVLVSDESDPKLLNLKKGQFATVEALFTGRVEDGVNRGIRGREFYLRFEAGRILEVAPSYEELKQAPPYK